MILAEGVELDDQDAQMRASELRTQWGVGLMERARISRQPAHLLLASEYGSATLNEKGSVNSTRRLSSPNSVQKSTVSLPPVYLNDWNSGKPAAARNFSKVNCRRSTGLHYFSVGDYNSETMRELSHQWLERIEDGEPLLVMMTAKGALVPNR